MNPGEVALTQYETGAIFLPDGTARADLTVVLQGPGAVPIKIYLRGLTGAVSATRMTDN
jgi:hypothetical protein